jgi:hypothetical protein
LMLRPLAVDDIRADRADQVPHAAPI